MPDSLPSTVIVGHDDIKIPKFAAVLGQEMYEYFSNNCAQISLKLPTTSLNLHVYICTFELYSKLIQN